MLLKNKDGQSIYLEYMLKVYLDDKEMYFATGNIPGKVISAFITIPTGFSKSIDVIECTGSVGSLSMDIYNDDNCNFSKILAEYERGAGFYFRKAELYLVKTSGESLLSTGLVRAIKPKDSFETMYTIEITDFMSELLKKPTLFYNSNKDFGDWFNNDLNNKPTNQFTINSQIVTVPIIITKYLNLQNKVELKLTGHPLDVAKFLIYSMYRENVAFNEVKFDLAKHDTYETILSKSEFILTEYIKDTLDYITKNIFRVCNVYPYLNKSGELCITRQKQLTVLDDLTLYFIEKSDIISVGGKTIDYSKVVNHLLTVRGTENKKDYFFDGNSFERFKKFLPEQPKEITIPKGTMTDNEVVIIGNDISLNLFAMFSNTYQEYVFEVELSEFDELNVGDMIAITHNLMIDSDTGERGIDETNTNVYLYCRLDIDLWGDYVPSYEGLTYLNENLEEQSYNVDKVVKTDWYNSVLNANLSHSNYSSFLRG